MVRAIANAAAALGGDVRSFTIDVGVDVISFGGTKNGLMYGEAVVFCRPELAARAAHVRKQLAQLPSKVRYISAQFLAILADGLWLRLAEHANAMATQLAAAVAAVPGVKVARAPAVNAVFVELPAAAISPLQEWCFFWVWDPHRSEVRWMTAWDTTPADIDAFVAGVRAVLHVVMTNTPPPTDVGQELRGRIHRGELGPGDRLPPERELATSFRVSRDRVREALLALENDGYVVARRGATGGRFVTELAAPFAAWAAKHRARARRHRRLPARGRMRSVPFRGRRAARAVI